MKSLTLLSILVTLSFFCTPLCASFHFSSTVIDTTDAFYTGYFTGFSYSTGQNLIEDKQGVLHFAYTANYELWYLRSDDDGSTWSNTKIPTGHEGGISRAALAINHDGHVFIGFSCNDNFKYSNPTGVSYGKEFHFDLYCANNISGSWDIETLYKPARSGYSDNYGPTAQAMLVDSANNIHLFANRDGWYNYGGTAWEYIRDAGSNTWGPVVQAAHFADQGVDHAIFPKYVPLQHKNGDITLLFSRHNNYELLYVQKLNGVWQTPVTITDEIAVAYNRFNAVITPEDEIILAYMKNNDQAIAELLISKDLNTAEKADIAFAVDDTLNYFNLHCDDMGKITLQLSLKSKNNTLTQSEDGADTWLGLYKLNDQENKLMPGGTFIHTDTRSGVYTDCQYYYFRALRTGSAPYGPDTLYYGKLGDLSGLENTRSASAQDYELKQNYPNPFNPVTVIGWRLAVGSHVELSVYNILGKKVDTLVSERMTPGNHSYTFDARDLASGVYYYELVTAGYKQVRKMILLR